MAIVGVQLSLDSSCHTAHTSLTVIPAKYRATRAVIENQLAAVEHNWLTSEHADQLIFFLKTAIKLSKAVHALTSPVVCFYAHCITKIYTLYS